MSGTIGPAPTLTTLADFNGTDGDTPFTDLITDANGDLFGTTAAGGANNDGVVFEVTKTDGTYSTPSDLVSFDNTDGKKLVGSLIADAHGDLFGETEYGGAGTDGTVFEIANNAGTYTSAPDILASFDGTNGSEPIGGLVADAEGNLFGVTYYGGANNDGAVFEIADISGTYASTPAVLASFDSTNGYNSLGPLVMDSNGDLFGVAQEGGDKSNYGTVFEIAKTDSGYASTPTVLVTFTGVDGSSPGRGLIMDAAGDLFGVTNTGGANNDGTVFEIAKTDSGYASTPTVLVNFNFTDGSVPDSALIMDADGDLFGVTFGGGTYGDGNVYEIVKTSGTYASTPTIVYNFDGSNGANPDGSLIADAEGNLFGTTSGGGPNGPGAIYGNGDGTVYEITNSGFVTNPVCLLRGTLVAAPGGEVVVEDLRPGDEVLTAAGVAPVRWVGRRAYDGRFINGNHLALPVTIAAGALGETMPARDLIVSPGHGIWVDGVLVPAWRLVNGVSITQAQSVQQVQYFNIELEGHGLLTAQGALVESFLDDGEFRNRFENVAEYWALYPDAPLCRDVEALPRVESGERLAEIQERLNLRAGMVQPRRELGVLRGFVDVPGDDGWVHGWAQDMAWPEAAVAIRIYARGQYIARTLANAYREDLRAAGLGSGCHAFSCRVPAGFAGDIVVLRELDGAVLEWAEGARKAAA